jgi:NADPH-dependent FMN reductase
VGGSPFPRLAATHSGQQPGDPRPARARRELLAPALVLNPRRWPYALPSASHRKGGSNHAGLSAAIQDPALTGTTGTVRSHLESQATHDATGRQRSAHGAGSSRPCRIPRCQPGRPAWPAWLPGPVPDPPRLIKAGSAQATRIRTCSYPRGQGRPFTMPASPMHCSSMSDAERGAWSTPAVTAARSAADLYGSSCVALGRSWRFGLLMPGNRRRQPVRFLVFSASLRRGSLNTRLAELAAAAIEAGGGDVDVAAMRDFDAPSYDQDVQFRRLEACHGFVVASPESGPARRRRRWPRWPPSSAWAGDLAQLGAASRDRFQSACADRRSSSVRNRVRRDHVLGRRATAA